jgi:hypothetical protein
MVIGTLERGSDLRGHKWNPSEMLVKSGGSFHVVCLPYENSWT